MEADWFQLAMAVLGGGAAAKFFDYLINRGKFAFDREALLWQKLGQLEQRCNELQAKLDQVATELNMERALVLVLKNEVNELLEDAQKPPRYPKP